MNFLGQDFQKLVHYRQTDRHTDAAENMSLWYCISGCYQRRINLSGQSVHRFLGASTSFTV